MVKSDQSGYSSDPTWRVIETPLARLAQLFQTVAAHDSLGLWAGETLNARKVVDFLNLDKRDVAKVAGVAPASVRFDQKIPAQVRERLEEVANIIALVAQFFGGDATRAALWFKTRSPLLGQVSPRDMIRAGRTRKLQRFVLEAFVESMATPIEASVGLAPPRRDSEPSRPVATGLDHPVIARHRHEIGRLCDRYGVQRLALFGSILRQDFDASSSDVDFVVEFGSARGVSPARQYFDFKSALEVLLGRKVDLVELQAMPASRLKRIIERTQVPVYGEAA